jgi:hypothetical protein
MGKNNIFKHGTFDALYLVIKKSRYLPVSDTYFPS